MKIPTGNFGQGATTGPVQHTRINTSGMTGARVANAAGNLANTLGNIVDQNKQIEAQKQADADALEAAKAANSLLDYEVQVSKVKEDVKNKIETGVISYEDGEKQFEEQVTQLEAPIGDNLHPARAVTFNGGVARLREVAKGDVGATVENARRFDFRSQYVLAQEKLDQLATDPNANIELINAKGREFKALAMRAGVRPDVFDKENQQHEYQRWQNQATGKFIAFRDNMAGLKALENEIGGEKGYYAKKLDPDRKNGLLSQINVRMAQLENKQEHESNKRESAAASKLKWLQDQQATGLMIDPAAIQAGREAVKGTSVEAGYAFAEKTAGEVQKIQSLPFDQQETYIQSLKTALAQTPTKDPAQQQRRIATLDTALTKNMELAKNSPLVFLQQRTGDPIPPLDLGALADPSKAQKVATQIMDRFNAIEGMRRTYGDKVGRNPWMPQEAEQIKTVFARMPDEQQLAVLGAIAGASNSQENFAGALKPLAADKPELMIAGLMRYDNRQTNNGLDLSAVVLNGAKIIRDKSVVLPTEAKLKAAFDDAIGQAIAPGTPERQMMYSTFKMMYAGVSEKRGLAAAEDDGSVNEDLVNLAVNFSTGGVHDVHDRNVILPYGMDADRFDDRLEAEVKRLSAETGFKDLESLPLIEADNEGEYYLLNGNNIKVTPDGKPIIVRIK